MTPKDILRLISLAVICALMLLTAQSAQASTGLTIFVSNDSTVVTDAQVLDDLPAFQAAVSQDFARFWGMDATLFFTNAPPVDSWQIDIQDTSPNPFALGYHTLLNDNPVAYVFAQSSQVDGVLWSEVFTHELFEMLADPYVNRIAQAQKLWLVEVCDPVEASAFDYTRLSASGLPVKISDFVTQSWYRRGSKRPYDFMNYISRPFQLLSGGYASYWANGIWNQVYPRRTMTR